MNLKQVGETIRTRRKEKDMSQKEFAALTNLSPSFISRVEGGEYKPSRWNCMNIAEVLGLDPDVLCFLAGHIGPTLDEFFKAAENYPLYNTMVDLVKAMNEGDITGRQVLTSLEELNQGV